MKYSKADWQVIKAVVKAVETLRKTAYVPNPATRGKPGGSTGNLAFNALKYEIRDGSIFVYVDKNIAPYVPYTNEPWLSTFWGGRKNPNEGWCNRFANKVIEMVAQELKGVIR